MLSPARTLDIQVTIAKSNPQISPAAMPNRATAIVCKAGCTYCDGLCSSSRATARA